MHEVDIVRQDVRAKACIAVSTPELTVAQCLSKSLTAVALSLLPLASLKRSAQNASHRSQKKAHSAGLGGVAPNYNLIDGLSIPTNVIILAGG